MSIVGGAQRHAGGSNCSCSDIGASATASKTSTPPLPEKSKRTIDTRFRDYFIRTNIDVFLIGIILACYHVTVAFAAEEAEHGGETAAGGGEEHGDAHSLSTGCTGSDKNSELCIASEEESETYSVLFPWFAEIVGVFVYFVLSRYAHAIPYTAVMFIVGIFIGISVQYQVINGITKSAFTWVNINGEVILLVFLPGLLYLDSFNIDIHLFVDSFSQLLTFAFPMVLGGTSLTALVAYYIFPYGWSFDLSMTFGSILAATDPVAVSVLLNELGAPPRLKMHVSGESLLNDGSAVVFYHIFSKRFYYEIGEMFGEDIGWSEGFAMFFRLSLGGTCIGIAFGVGLLVILYNLNRRLSGEDSVVQVVATITTAYLAFFTSEILAKCSGILSVVFLGVTVKAFGETLYNDTHLSIHFWEITEYLLNTLLFTLGGCVWGELASGKAYTTDNDSGTVSLTEEPIFDKYDWGYLFLLYLLVIIIRFFLVFAFYPCTSRIGLKSNWREAVFMSYGGLRGAVGIALALSLHAEVQHFVQADDVSDYDKIKYQEFSAKVFGMVGGIALLTLVINAPTCGLLLKRLGLVTPTETRLKVIENYWQHMIQYTVTEYVKLLTEKRFQDIDFTVIKEHVPCLRDITYEQLLMAVDKHKATTPAAWYKKPNLKNVIPYLYKKERAGEKVGVDMGTSDHEPTSQRPFRRSIGLLKDRRQSVRHIRESHGNRQTIFDLRTRYDERTVHEERLVFLKILRSSYWRLIEHGEIESRGFIVHTLGKSLEYAEESAGRGLPISDWNALEVATDSYARPAESILYHVFSLKQRIKHKDVFHLDLDYALVAMKVRQILAFMSAHERARRVFKEEFSKAGGSGTLTAAEKIVIDESDEQVALANEALSELDQEDVAMVKSHYACQILLNRAAYYFKKLKKSGLMTEKEAGEFLEEIEGSVFELLECRETHHEHEMTLEDKNERLTALPDVVRSTWVKSMVAGEAPKLFKKEDGEEEEPETWTQAAEDLGIDDALEVTHEELDTMKNVEMSDSDR